MRTVGLCGRRPGKLQTEKYEKPWKISDGMTKHKTYRLIEKNVKAIEILQD